MRATSRHTRARGVDLWGDTEAARNTRRGIGRGGRRWSRADGDCREEARARSAKPARGAETQQPQGSRARIRALVRKLEQAEAKLDAASNRLKKCREGGGTAFLTGELETGAAATRTYSC